MLCNKRYKLLMKIVNSGSMYRGSNKLFCKRDNCIQSSKRSISRLLVVPITTINNLFADCIDKGIVSKVIDISGKERLMINPRFYWGSDRRELPLAIFMYETGSYSEGVKHRRYCENLGAIFCPVTGEVVSRFNWGQINQYAASYSRYDVNARKD